MGRIKYMLWGRGEEYFAGSKSRVNLGIPIHLILDQFRNNLLNEGIKSLPYLNNALSLFYLLISDKTLKNLI